MKLTEAIKIEKVVHPKIGEGAFLIRDVAEILQLPYSKVRHWLVEFWDSRFASNHKYSLGTNDNRVVNFYTMIEFYTFYHLRKKGLSSQKIQKYHHQLSKYLKTNYPFARTIHTDGKSIWYEALGELIKADGKMQLDLKSFLTPFLSKIEFGKSGLAEKFYPLSNSSSIVIDPKHQFGSPTITGTNIKALIIKEFYSSGETVDSICEFYDLTEKQVTDAIKYYNRAA